MADLVRVRVPGGTTSTSRAWAEAHDLDVLDEPTVKRDGTVRGFEPSPQKKAAITRATQTPDDASSSVKKAASASAKTAEEASE